MQTKIQLPKFEGKLLVPKELKEAFPQADILGGDFGKAVLEEANARIKEEYNDNSNLYVFSYDKKDNIVRGSSTSGNILLNQIISNQYPKLHIATQADLEAVLRVNALNLSETYEDTGLVLLSEASPNQYLAKDLSKQLKDRKELQYPVLIHLKDLVLRNDDNSPLGLAFNIKENAEFVYDSILNSSGNFSTEDVNEKTGLPTKVGKGDKYFYTRNNGLSRLYLNSDLTAYAINDGLANSYGYGRVVVVSAEGAKKISKDYMLGLEQERERQIKEVESRYNKAMNILKGN